MPHPHVVAFILLRTPEKQFMSWITYSKVYSALYIQSKWMGHRFQGNISRFAMLVSDNVSPAFLFHIIILYPLADFIEYCIQHIDHLPVWKIDFDAFTFFSQYHSRRMPPQEIVFLT